MDGMLLEIDCIAVENEVTDNLYKISAIDYLIYNDSVKYAELIQNGNVREYQFFPAPLILSSG